MTIAIILQGREGAVFTASPDELVESVVARLAEKRIGALPVVENGEVLGIFSERDVIYGLASHGAALMAKRVGDVMTAPAITVTADTPVLSALSLMTRRRIRHLPVADGVQISGFVSIGDLVKYRIEKIEAEASAMRDYIQMA
ncbi:MAG: CBS domain-containing protein [Sphingomonadales bacterium]|nr:CBS domain-containing protein [Sphingomonadales bacterium]MBK9002731.1 CBS domain-containing protein [Sphingomonadales bacterium]MBK9267953.1 CBS domain-containing protein [Sphingomonadales bacterium]MBP6433413.1 CBS domain-containing protein [Sphingorhabdus sp.]